MTPSSIASNAPSADDPAAAPNQRVVRRLFESILNSGKLEQLDEVIGAEYVGTQGELGPAAFRAVISRLRSGMPDLTYTLDELVSSGDLVSVRWHMRGTHTGTLNGYPPTHKTLENTGMAIFELREGKVVRGSLETDRLGFLQQLGVLPPLVGLAPRPDLRFHVDRFKVPEAARGEFEAAMTQNLRFLRTLPGFVGHTVLQNSSGGSPEALRPRELTTIVIWQNQQALEAAGARMKSHLAETGFDPAASLSKWGVTLERAVFQAPVGLQ